MSLLRDRRLAALLGAEVISSLGTQMTWLALPWFVLRTTGSPQRMTWVLIAEIVPIALLGFWGGAIAARIGTRRTMLICDLARVPLLGAIPLLQSLGLLPFPVLLALVAASGVFIAPYMGVQRAVVPELVGEEHGDVATATALFQAANRLTILVGPPLAGVLIAVIGASNVLYVDAASYLVSFLLLLVFVHPPEVPAQEDERGVLAGVRFLFSDRLLRVWMPALTLLDVCWTLFFASLPVLVVTKYGADPHILGWLFGALGGGALVGRAGRAPDRPPRRSAGADGGGVPLPDGGDVGRRGSCALGRAARRDCRRRLLHVARQRPAARVVDAAHAETPPSAVARGVRRLHVRRRAARARDRRLGARALRHARSARSRAHRADGRGADDRRGCAGRARDVARRDGRRLARVKRLEGKHAVVTGAGTGIGRAIAQRLADEGARLTLLARDVSRLQDVVPGATVRACDIRDREQVLAAIDEPLDFLVANAGIGGPNEPGDDDRWDDIVQTNLFGTYWCCRAAEPHLPEGGRIVITASILARIGVSGYTAYCASKAGLLGLTRSLAAELAPRRDPGERDLPRLGEHRHGVAGARRVRGSDPRRGVRGGDARGAAAADERARRDRGHGRVAPLPRRARRHGPGDRPQQRRVHALSSHVPGTVPGTWLVSAESVRRGT